MEPFYTCTVYIVLIIWFHYKPTLCTEQNIVKFSSTKAQPSKIKAEKLKLLKEKALETRQLGRENHNWNERTSKQQILLANLLCAISLFSKLIALLAARVDFPLPKPNLDLSSYLFIFTQMMYIVMRPWTYFTCNGCKILFFYFFIFRILKILILEYEWWGKERWEKFPLLVALSLLHLFSLILTLKLFLADFCKYVGVTSQLMIW